MALAAELEGLFDEYAQAQTLDPRRARAIAKLILERAGEAGLIEECAASALDPEAALARLDAWLCDLKDMRIGDGLHVFGRRRTQNPARRIWTSSLERERRRRGGDRRASRRLRRGGNRRAAGGARRPLRRRRGRPARPRADGWTSCRPGAICSPSIRAPCRPAPLGKSAGAPPRRSWRAMRRIMANGRGGSCSISGASASMRTGGDDIAQAFALLGVRPLWDHASNRVSGYEILPVAMLGRARVDVDVAHLRAFSRCLSRADRLAASGDPGCRGAG